MAVQKVLNVLLLGLAADTKPLTYATGTLFIETDTAKIYRWNGSTWSVFLGLDKSETLSNKSISGSSNTLTNIPDSALSSNIPLKNASNTFTAQQKINLDAGQQMIFYRPNNTNGNGVGFYYRLNDSASAEQTFGSEYVTVEDNTATSYRGDFKVELAIAASLGIRFRVYTSGNGGIIFGSNRRIQLDEGGLTAARVFTFPDTTVQLIGTSDTATLTNKSITAANNTITDTSAATGDLFYFNGTRFVRFARGSTNQVLQSTASTIQWATFNAENTGIATASGNGSTTAFTIAHSIGAVPSVYYAGVISHQTTATVTADSTNLTVTCNTAPSSGTNNVKIYWRAIA